MFGDLRKTAALILWIVGFVVASGFWSTLFAVVIPPYAWYLAVKCLLQFWGVI